MTELDKDLKNLALYGYGIFTTMLVTQEGIRGLNLHIDRIQESSQMLFSCRPSKEEILHEIVSYLNRSLPKYPFVLRMTVYPADFSMLNPQAISNLIFQLEARPAPSATNAQPMNLKVIQAIRALPEIKSTNLMSSLYARKVAKEQGAHDALLMNDGEILEGSTWNIFFISNQTIYTPPLSAGILAGTTRHLLLEQAKQHGIKIIEAKIMYTDIEPFNFAFVTNAVVGLQPVMSIDDRVFMPQHWLYDKLISIYKNIPIENAVSHSVF